MNKPFTGVPIRVLLVDDDPGDVYLTQELLRESKLHAEIDVVHDGEQAMAYLRRQGSFARAVSPDLILLDLNMPRKDGRQVLAEIKSDPQLRHIPVVVLTTSQADVDIVKSYEMGANCYVSKPVGLEQFSQVVKSIESFWFTIVKLPRP